MNIIKHINSKKMNTLTGDVDMNKWIKQDPMFVKLKQNCIYDRNFEHTFAKNVIHSIINRTHNSQFLTYCVTLASLL